MNTNTSIKQKSKRVWKKRGMAKKRGCKKKGGCKKSKRGSKNKIIKIKMKNENEKKLQKIN